MRHEGGSSFATLPGEERRGRIRASDGALLRKLEGYYGPGAVPTSRAIWRDDIFQGALDAGA